MKPKPEQNRCPRPLRRAAIAALLMITLASCRSMGPKTIPPDGFNYNARIALQQNEQLLLNIVRLRYAEVPLFLHVNSMINQYSRTGAAGISGTDLFNTPIGSGNLSGIWTDRPTITYTPMSGQAYTQSLLTPLPPQAVFFLIQSGWSPDRLLRLSASSINGLKNEVSAPRLRRMADPGFTRLLTLMGNLKRDGALGLQIGGTEDEPTIDLFFPEQIAEDSIRDAVDEFKQLLRLDPDQNNFPIRYGLIREGPDEIVVQTHSMLEILLHTSWYMDVPPEHIAEGRTGSTFLAEGEPLLRISASRSRPATEFVTINTRGHWYYIDDRDLNSKTVFAVIQVLLNLARDGDQAVAPLISIGN